MITPEEMHALIDQAPETDLGRLALYARYLQAGETPLLRTLLTAPINDEPLTTEDEAAIEEGLRAIERGEVSSPEDLEREFGLR